MPIEIRQAGAADWPSIWPIFAAVVQAADTFVYDPAMSSEAASAMWLEAAPSSTWIAVGDGDQVLGTYKTGPNRPGPGSHVATASYMVAAAARGQGVGRRLVEHSLARSRAAGFRGIQFNAVAASNRYAIQLYQQLGFDIAGRIPGGFAHPQQGFVDLLIMYAEL